MTGLANCQLETQCTPLPQQKRSHPLALSHPSCHNMTSADRCRDRAIGSERWGGPCGERRGEGVGRVGRAGRAVRSAGAGRRVDADRGPRTPDRFRPWAGVTVPLLWRHQVRCGCCPHADRRKTVKWQRSDGVPDRPHHYRREDGWSIYLADQELVRWSLCQPDGKAIPGVSGLPPDPIEPVITWADQVIARLQGKN